MDNNIVVVKRAPEMSEELMPILDRTKSESKREIVQRLLSQKYTQTTNSSVQ